jgi:recombination protein RecA
MAKVKTFLDRMQDMYGDDYDKIFVSEEEKIDSISTGSLSLDASIGVGGVPRGRFTLIDGAESSGKTSIAMSICKQALLKGLNVTYIDVENQAPLDYMEDLAGEKVTKEGRLKLAKPRNSDEAFNIIEAGILSGEGLIILDSIAALSPTEEQDKKFEDANMAIIPRDLAKFFRRNAYRVRENKTAVVFINQVRDNIGSYVKSFSNPGGHALKHYASVIISLSKAQEIKAGESVIGIMTKFTIKKNKVAPPFRSFMIPIIFGVGVDTLRDTVSYAEFLGVIRRGGPYYKLDDQVLGKGMVETMETLENDKLLLDKLKERVYNIHVKYDKEIIEEGDVDE